MKKTIFYIILITVFFQYCTDKQEIEKEPVYSETRFKIVDKNYQDIIFEPLDTVEFYYLNGTKKETLKTIKFEYENTGIVYAVQDIPELSSEGKVRYFYLKTSGYPIDTLYLEIWKTCGEPPYTACSYNYTAALCNGVSMEFNSKKLFYYIKK